MIAIIDYDMGNLRSVHKAFESIAAKCEVTRDPQVIAKADKLVLPGVGAFADCMENLKNYGLLVPIKDFVESGKPYLGICLGMQLLMSLSEEGGSIAGMSLLPGEVKRFSPQLKLKVPHMGWNSLHLEKKDSALLKGIPEGAYFYFVHSYYVVPNDAKKVAAASTDYGHPFVSCIEYKNIYATQFHPEKSQALGLKVLENFHKL